jgi:hypothetical protein
MTPRSLAEYRSKEYKIMKMAIDISQDMPIMITMKIKVAKTSQGFIPAGSPMFLAAHRHGGAFEER